MTTGPAADATAREHLLDGSIELLGRVRQASNATFLAEVDGVRAVYKPIRGERPLWDFPDGSLAGRELATWRLSEATGWRIVPPTVFRDGPHGPGMVQLWCEPDLEQDAVEIVPGGSPHPGLLEVFDGVDQDDRPVTLVHEDTPALRRMALLDVVANNADRKGGHILEMPGGHRHGVDHGLTFHVEPKLRTVLWGWAGTAIADAELAVLSDLADALRADLGDDLGRWITPPELDATRHRCGELLRGGTFPLPDGDWPVIPWPPF